MRDVVAAGIIIIAVLEPRPDQQHTIYVSSTKTFNQMQCQI